MRSSTLKPVPHRNKLARRIILAGWIGVCVASVGAITQSQAQDLLPADRQEITDQERPILDSAKVSSAALYERDLLAVFQGYAAFFRDSLLQFVARTYYLTRDNFDGSKSQAWLRLFLHAPCCVFALAPLVKQAS